MIPEAAVCMPADSNTRFESLLGDELSGWPRCINTLDIIDPCN